MTSSLSHLEYARACQDARVAGSREAYNRTRLVRSATRDPFNRRTTR